jgi:hypothetical protein
MEYNKYADDDIHCHYNDTTMLTVIMNDSNSKNDYESRHLLPLIVTSDSNVFYTISETRLEVWA